MTTMSYNDFLNAIIDDGQSEVRLRFNKPEQKLRLDGCLDGFEACRGLTPEEIVAARDAATKRRQQALRRNDPRYWYFREREGQIEFVLGTVAWFSVHHRGPCWTTIYTRHQRKAMDVLGIQPLTLDD